MSELIDTAVSRFRLSFDAWRKTYQCASDDIRFATDSDSQWPEDIKNKRALQGRPCFTENCIPTYVNQVVNEFRQNMPGIEVNPDGEAADTETADIIGGLIRSIENRSNTPVVYSRCFGVMTKGGISWSRVQADYDDDSSADQSLFIRQVRDFSTVFPDPMAQEPDMSDMEWCFVISNMSHDEFKREYPDAEMSSNNNFDSMAKLIPDWVTSDTVQIAEYWYKDHKKVRKTVYVDQAGNKTLIGPGEPVPVNLKPMKRGKNPLTRVVDDVSVKCCIINGAEVLDEYDWAGKYIPLVPWIAQEEMVAGERMIQGLVKNMKDPQVNRNAMVTAQIEAIALTPKSPYIAEAGSIAQYSQIWKTANQETYSVLPWDSMGGKYGPPTRINSEANVMAITEAKNSADLGMQFVTGLFPASLGMRSSESSGKAILAKQKEGDTATFGYLDNGRQAVAHHGRIILDLIPYYFDKPRVVSIIRPNQQQEIVKINQEFQDKAGKNVTYDMTVGKYVVSVTSGPSYQTLREQTFDRMTQIIQAYPQFVQIAGDLFFKTVPLPSGMGDEIADRLHSMLPPQLQQAAQMPPAAMAQMQQLGQQNQAMVAEIHKLSQILETKQLERQADMEKAQLQSQADLAKTKLQEQTKITVALIGAKNAQATQAADAELKMLLQNREHTSDFLMAAADHEANHQTLDKQAELSQQTQANASENESPQS